MSVTTPASAHSTAHCPECAPRLPLRNHWFWGKCIVPRDLTDEQFFFLDKLRLHNQRLHGTGIVCGLELGPHTNPLCRDRLIVLSAGSAIDCCGHDILMLEEDVVDLTRFDAVAKLIATPDGKPHRLRFCLRYRECPTEEVPVLYDECACDDTRCAPNRILETYAVELEIDPPPLVHQVLQPRFTRLTTLLITGTRAVALDPTGGRILVLAGASLFELDAVTHALGAPRPLAADGRALAIAADGSRAELIVGGDATTDPKLVVLDIAGPVPVATAAAHEGILIGSLDSATDVAETAAANLVAVIDTLGGVRLLPGPTPDPTQSPDQSDAGAVTRGLAFSGAGTTAYLAEPGSPRVHVVALDQPALPQTVLTLSGASGATAQADVVGLIASTGPDRLAVLDHATPRLHLVDPATGTVEGSVVLDYPPVDLVVTPGGQWALVIVDNGTTSWVQAVNLHLIRQGVAVQAGTAEKLGPNAGKPVLGVDGSRLYVPIKDGVAILDVDDVDCGALLRGGDCPGCHTPDCLVLATVENWQPGFTLEALGPTPRDPVADAAAKVARLDNRTERTTLPSTQDIAAALECLIAHSGAGGPGPQGPPGPPGTNGNNGTNGKDAIDTTLTHICAMNWRHAGAMKAEELVFKVNGERLPALVIAFSNATVPDPGKVRPKDLNDISFTLLIEHAEVEGERVARLCWCQIPAIKVLGVQLKTECDPTAGVFDPLPGGLCDGAAYQFDKNLLLTNLEAEKLVRERANFGGPIRCKVLVQGDLIRDLKGRGLDANHLPPWLGTAGTVTGNGIAGGLFESWFSIS